GCGSGVWLVIGIGVRSRVVLVADALVDLVAHLVDRGGLVLAECPLGRIRSLVQQSIRPALPGLGVEQLAGLLLGIVQNAHEGSLPICNVSFVVWVTLHNNGS